MGHFPKLVNTICHAFEGWIVGGAANPEDPSPKDYDIVIPFHKWHEACVMVPDEATKNSFGGWKFKDPETGKDIDMWPGEASWVLTRPKCKFAYHPLSGTLLEKETWLPPKQDS